MKVFTKLSILCCSLFLVAAFILSSPTQAYAATEGDYTYTVSNGEATITGYSGISCDIIIPSTLGGYPVTSIGSFAFYDRTRLTSVTLPDSVTSIGDGAFYSCDSLTSVIIPDSVTSIGNYVFCGCTGLTSVTIGDSVTSIGDSTFNDCTGLTSVTIPESVTSIGGYAFYNCSSLTSVTIPNSVTSIGDRAFWDCTGLTSVTIGNSVTRIGDYAFYNCSNLTGVYITDVAEWCNVTFSSYDANPLAFAKNLYLNGDLVTDLVIPDSVASIGRYAFLDCGHLTSVIIPDSVTSIGNSAFKDCYSLTSVTIPDSVTSIGDYAFCGCTGLTSVTIGDSVTSIGGDAFHNCSSLTSVIIPDSVTSIGDYAFYNCYSLTSVIIPDSVTSIGDYAFDYCESLTSVTYCGTEEQWNNISIGSYNTIMTSKTRYYHSWNAATCTSPKTCAICGEIEGQKLSHSYDNGLCTACGELESYSWTLAANAVVDICLNEDLYIDLNGYDLSGTIITNGYKIYGMDSTTYEYTCDSVGYFNCVDENGNAIIPESLYTTEEMERHMTIGTDDGYTFHRFYLGITNISLAPAVTGFGYKAEFFGDEMVQSNIASVGYNLWLGDGNPVSRTTNFKNVVTLRLQNFDVVNYGEIPVNATATITLTDGTTIESATASYSMRQMVELVNEQYSDLNETQLSALQTMLTAHPAMQSWQVENIFKKSA